MNVGGLETALAMNRDVVIVSASNRGYGARSASDRSSPWVSVDVAAHTLGMSSEALRKKLDRRSRPGPDGVVEADIDGVRARKFGRLWRVRFAARWLEPVS
jgi:hypothetical protein